LFNLIFCDRITELQNDDEGLARLFETANKIETKRTSGAAGGRQLEEQWQRSNDDDRLG